MDIKTVQTEPMRRTARPSHVPRTSLTVQTLDPTELPNALTKVNSVTETRIAPMELTKETLAVRVPHTNLKHSI